MVSLWTLFWLVGGELIRNQHHQGSGSKWSGVCILVGSVLLLTVNVSHLVWVSVSAKQLGDIVACINWSRTKTLSQDCTIGSLECLFFLWVESPSFPNLTTAWGKVMEAEWSSFPVIKEMGGTGRLLCSGAPQGPAQYQDGGQRVLTSCYRMNKFWRL